MALQPLFGGYAAQVEPQRTATALPTATPEDYGAGIGDALLGAGNVAGQIAIRERRLEAERDYDNQLIEKQVEFAQQQADFEILKNEDRQNGQPGHQGHAAAMRQWIDKAGEDFLGGIEHQGLRQKFTARFEEWKTGRVVEADAFERISTTKLRVTQIQTGLKLMANRARDLDPVAFGELQQEIATAERPEGVPADAFMALQHDAGRMAWASFLEGRAPDVRLAMLDSGLADAFLSPEEKDQLRRGGQIELKAERLEAEEAAKDARDAAREKLKILKGRIERLETVSPKDAEAVFAEARAAGIPASELEADVASYYDSRRNAPYGPDSDPTGARAARRIAELDAKRDSGQALTPEDRRDYAALEGAAKARAREQGQALKAAAARGPAGQIDALNQIAQLPTAEQRFVAAQELGDGLNLGHIALLSSNSRTLAVNGRDVRKARPKEFGEKAVVEQRFARLVGVAGPALGGDYGAMQDLAWDIYAGMSNAAGDTGWNRTRFDTAVRVAFGATRRRDGRLAGGLGEFRERPVILPDNLTSDEFDVAVSRLTFADGVYADGSPARKGDILSRFRPEYAGMDADGVARYRMIGPDNKPLRMKDGSVFPVRVAPKARR